MMHRLIFIIAMALLCPGTAFPQDNAVFFSEPTGLPQVGWNKVHCMKNGNTLLFHLEPTKKIVVKVYDSLHKMIASQEHVCRVTDIYILKDVLFKGLHEINGEAVLFLQQVHVGKDQLVRMRFSGSDGTLLDEKVLGEARNLNKHTNYYVAKAADNEYAILTSVEMPHFQDYKLNISVYNKEHVAVKEIPLPVEDKKYDYLDVVGFESASNGLCISVNLSILESNGTASTGAGSKGTQAIYDHLLGIFYVPKDSSAAYGRLVNVSTSVFPYYTHYTYNSFAKTLNLLLLSMKGVVYQNGAVYDPGTVMSELFLKVDESSMDIAHNWVSEKIANTYMKDSINISSHYEGMPVKLYTNDNGLSTMISESYTIYYMPQRRAGGDYNTYLGNIAITQLDDDGKEIWGTLLPNIQCYSSFRQYYYPYTLAKRWQEQRVFSDQPEQVYNRQFISFNPCLRNKEYYIIYNDYNSNFNNTIKHPGDTVYDFSSTNACYYKMNRKKEVTKHYLFGTPTENEYTACFIEGADYDEQRGIYASLVQQRKGDATMLCMAWRRLD